MPDATLYFPTLDGERCAKQVARLLSDPDLKKTLATGGAERIQDFRWSGHAECLVASLRNETRSTADYAA